VLGLGAALSNTPYEITAELLDNSQVVFVRRKNLMKFLREHREARLRIVHILSQDLHMAYERVRTVGAIRTHHPRMVVRPRAMAGLSSTVFPCPRIETTPTDQAGGLVHCRA
jgi:CRP-like cAMP-binding protein